MAKKVSRGYNGNPQLPLPEEQVQLTQEELAEYIKCSQSPHHFINNYVQIVHVDRGIVTFKMFPFQEKLVDAFEDNRFVICKLARQSGKSTVVVQGYLLWYLLFHPDVSVGILANKEATAIELLRRLKSSFELLPRFLKQGIVKWDGKLISFGNNSRCRAESTSASAVRGDTFNLLFLDEYAFVPDHIADDFMRSVFPTISSGKTTKMFIVSTPQGYNMFYKIWHEAEEKMNSFVPIGFTWRDVPGREALNEKGENIWEKEERANMGDSAFEQEQECSFMGSANTLIPMSALMKMQWTKPIEERGNFKEFKIYQKPIYMTEEGPSHVYIITVDTSQGQGLDSSVANVIDVSVSPFRQVAIYRHNQITPQQFAPTVLDIAKFYNNAFILCEINNEGEVVADLIANELEYENLMNVFTHPKKGQVLSGGFQAKSRLGLKVTEKTKRIGCTGLKSLVEKEKLLVSDFQTYRELTTYVAKNASYEAEMGNHDDTTATLILLGWLSLQVGFENYTGLSMRKMLVDGHSPVTLDAPGFLISSNDGPAVLGQTQQGFEIVDDNDFWGVN